MVSIAVVDVLKGNDSEEAWALYYEAFRELNEYAAQRHLMHRHEFDDVMGDPRIDKYVATLSTVDPDQPSIVGLATYSNDFDAMPLLSGPYFARRFPELYAAGKIWCCGFVAIAPTGRGVMAFHAIIKEMAGKAAAVGGMSVLDFCRHNAEVRRMDTSIANALRRIAGARAELLDDQQFWGYRYPEVKT